MLKMIASLFASPERLLNVMSRNDMQEAKDDGERILIDEDGAASVNLQSAEVHEDFARHVEMLRHTRKTPLDDNDQHHVE
ncbi:hypothetical protein [Erwinia phyllosphaerae]|uniref:hypothetical protein n=1 Tax=Erwinia phyllosphaerae TaxID=2853256 RepID=UPI001FF00CAB|nr:hypothetical protein [Erwinia phyllosphaerae]MBV4366667.1 hypothetical protein [Erwinia phyllosphaerae]